MIVSLPSNKSIKSKIELTYIHILVAQSVKNPPAMQEMGFNPQIEGSRERIPLEKEMATHSHIPAWEIPWTEDPGGLQSMGLQESDMT